MKFMNKAKVLLAIFFCLFLINSECIPEIKEKPKNEGINMTLDEAKEVGKRELKKRGYPVEDMRVEADEKNTAWQEFIAKDPSILQRQIVKRMNLEDKNYWVIYYAPKKIQLGGDAWVFVDKNEGKIIGVILGE